MTDSYTDGNKLSPLASASATRAVLEAHGLATKHSLGQNFLVNGGILQKIVKLAALEEADSVLEVGPGIGTLTIALLKNAGCVTSVEFDHDLPAVLRDTLAPWWDRFALVEKDALALQPADLEVSGFPLPNKLVSNLPYAVAATVVLGFFEQFPSLQSATVMVQKEVADRMAATPGSKNYGAYTVKLGLFAEPAGRFPVGPSNFFPPPRIDSAVIRLNRRAPLDAATGEPATPAVLAAAAVMADAAFASRRKTIANSCKTYFSGRGAVRAGERELAGADVAACVPALLEAAGIDAKRRGETLDQQEFLRLAHALLALQR